jgi:hypothetical protein
MIRAPQEVLDAVKAQFPDARNIGARSYVVEFYLPDGSGTHSVLVYEKAEGGYGVEGPDFVSIMFDKE